MSVGNEEALVLSLEHLIGQLEQLLARDEARVAALEQQRDRVPAPASGPCVWTIDLTVVDQDFGTITGVSPDVDVTVIDGMGSYVGGVPTTVANPQVITFPVFVADLPYTLHCPTYFVGSCYFPVSQYVTMGCGNTLTLTVQAILGVATSRAPLRPVSRQFVAVDTFTGKTVTLTYPVTLPIAGSPFGYAGCASVGGVDTLFFMDHNMTSFGYYTGGACPGPAGFTVLGATHPTFVSQNTCGTVAPYTPALVLTWNSGGGTITVTETLPPI